MCMQLYIGLDNELCDEGQGSEFRPWRLHQESNDDNFADKYLTKKYRYGLMGCACDLWYDLNQPIEIFDGMTDDEIRSHTISVREGNKRRKQGVEKLFSYISSNVESDNCELVSFWAGEYKMEHNDILDLKGMVLGDDFKFFKEGQYITVHI